jgi:hypothetical protein
MIPRHLSISTETLLHTVSALSNPNLIAVEGLQNPSKILEYFARLNRHPEHHIGSLPAREDARLPSAIARHHSAAACGASRG